MKRKPIQTGIEIRTRDIRDPFQPIIERRPMDAQFLGSLGDASGIVEKEPSVSNSAESSSRSAAMLGSAELGVLVISGQQRQVAVDPKAFPRRAGAQVRDGPEHLKHGRGLCVGIVQVQHVHLRADADPQVRIEPRTGYAHKGAGGRKGWNRPGRRSQAREKSR